MCRDGRQGELTARAKSTLHVGDGALFALPKSLEDVELQLGEAVLVQMGSGIFYPCNTTGVVASQEPVPAASPEVVLVGWNCGQWRCRLALVLEGDFDLRPVAFDFAGVQHHVELGDL